ncbi:histidine kinase [Planomonospora parontospora]|uniref:histidine kinase n=1 Tax=Planomonospora parontospora TaxID=58119 RepID=UPI00194DC9D5|nr:histidine kinase [Planomonospora parontospora]
MPTFVRGMVTWAAAYALGRAVAMHRAYTAGLEERAVRLEREREIEAERAAERERARIARDMHDVLAHAVSVMVVQAEAGPLAVRSNPERAEAAFHRRRQGERWTEWRWTGRRWTGWRRADRRTGWRRADRHPRAGR